MQTNETLEREAIHRGEIKTCPDCQPLLYQDQGMGAYGPTVILCQKHGLTDDLHRLLAHIIDDLPHNRDWLDPELESESRALLDVFKQETLTQQKGNL